MLVTAWPVPIGRSMQIVVVSRNRTAIPNSVARVASITSFCTSPYSDTDTCWVVGSCRKLISGSCSASWLSAVCSVPRSWSCTAVTTVSRVGGANQWASGACAVPIESPIRTDARPHTLAI